MRSRRPEKLGAAARQSCADAGGAPDYGGKYAALTTSRGSVAQAMALTHDSAMAGGYAPTGENWQRRWRQACIGLLDVLLPPLCLMCSGRVALARGLCSGCWSQLQLIDEPRCPKWGEPLTFDAGPGVLSARALAREPVWANLRAAVVYDDASRKLVHALKYHDRLEAALLMARLMHRTAGDILTKQALLVPVPLHPWRLWQRRYNQSALLARHLAILSGAENKPNLMVRQRATRKPGGSWRGGTPGQPARRLSGSRAIPGRGCRPTHLAGR